MVPAGFITGLSAATLWTAHAQYTTQLSTELGKFQRYNLKFKFLFTSKSKLTQTKDSLVRKSRFKRVNNGSYCHRAFILSQKLAPLLDSDRSSDTS